MKLIILVALAPAVHPNPSELVNCCINANKKFTKCEEKYVDKRVYPEEEPNLPGPQIEEFQKVVYEIETRQRPFECISNRTDNSSMVFVKLTPEYIALETSCKSKQYHPICKPLYKYRTLDGTCNNLMYPKWGSQFNCLRWHLPQRYEGAAGFRQSVCGGPLPEPRQLSLGIHTDRNVSSETISHTAIFFGQLLAHDIADVSTTFVSTKPIDCCSHPGKKQHPQCAPIIIRKDDPFYSKFNVTCFNFVRAAICDTCYLGKRNQMSQVSSYIDLSVVYGLNENQSKSLRSKDGKGKLESQYKNGEELMPPGHSLDAFGGCGPDRTQEFCFSAGDRRANMHTMLMSFQTIFKREHNRIAEQLYKLNPDWDDETLFQEARKINIAQMQVIVYKEFLPNIIGPKLMTLYGLHNTGQSIYDATTDATLKAEFNMAAFRFHSFLNGIVAEQDSAADELHLRKIFQDAVPLHNGSMSSLMSGLCKSHSQKYDRFVTDDMKNFLYKPPKGLRGFDIVAVNIQRGRDGGVPTYTEVVNYLSKENKNDIQTFEQLSSLMEESNIKLLKENYCNVKDIDLWVGMNNEKVQDNMLIGPTAATIIAKQFGDLKDGDRFFFQHFGNFDLKQFESLKQTSLARIFCDNTKIQSIQQNALRIPSSSNPVLPCENIPKVDLGCWGTPKILD